MTNIPIWNMIQGTATSLASIRRKNRADVVFGSRMTGELISLIFGVL